MGQLKIPAVFMRGGTSRALFFREADLPPDPDLRDRIFLAALGSPDPYGRQLDGVGGGISSTSKIAIIARSARADADVDYTFGQASVTAALVDYKGNCGNISSAVGPYAIDEELVKAREPETGVRIHNTNTGKLIVARVPTAGGAAAVEGDFAIQGVAGTGAKITLEFLDPGGAVTGKLLPTGQVQEPLEVPGVGTIAASIVDATNPMVFVRAADLSLTGTESPEAIDRDAALMERLERIRATVAVRLGLATDLAEASRTSQAVPKIALVAPPAAYRDLAGAPVAAGAMDISARVISMGKAHRAFALTGAMCLAVAAHIRGTVAGEAARGGVGPDVRIGHPSGVLPIGAAVREQAGGWVAEKVVVYRTARRLMDGFVRVPESLLRPS